MLNISYACEKFVPELIFDFSLIFSTFSFLRRLWPHLSTSTSSRGSEHVPLTRVGEGTRTAKAYWRVKREGISPPSSITSVVSLIIISSVNLPDSTNRSYDM